MNDQKPPNQTPPSNIINPENWKSKSAIDVTYDTEKVEDKWATGMLRNIGTSLKQDESMSYLGSLSIHFYAGEMDQISLKQSIATIQQICLDDVSEPVAKVGMQNLTIAIMKYFGHKYSTRNENDKR